MVLAKIWNLSTNLTVLHQHQLGWGDDGEWLGPEGFPYGVGSNNEGDSSSRGLQFNTPLTEEPGDQTDQESDTSTVTDAQYEEESAALAKLLGFEWCI